MDNVCFAKQTVKMMLTLHKGDPGICAELARDLAVKGRLLHKIEVQNKL